MDIIVSTEQARVPVTVLTLKGRFDATAQKQFLAVAEKEIQSGARYMALDFSGVDYISSAGVRGIDRIFDLLRPHTVSSDEAMQKGVRDGSYKSPNLKLANLQPRVLEPVKMVGIDMLLDIHPDLKSALASF
jgi:anti-anti-sigma regulatory factor